MEILALIVYGLGCFSLGFISGSLARRHRSPRAMEIDETE